MERNGTVRSDGTERNGKIRWNGTEREGQTERKGTVKSDGTERSGEVIHCNIHWRIQEGGGGNEHQGQMSFPRSVLNS